LSAPPATPEPEARDVSPLAQRKWARFLARQEQLEHDKRRREGKLRKRSYKTTDGPVYEKLFLESTAERREWVKAGEAPPVRQAVEGEPSFTKRGSRPPRASKAVVQESEGEISERQFSELSRKLTNGSASFRKRVEQTCDLKQVLARERARNREAEERKQYYDKYDE
jgi:hypothetical protein